MPNIEEYRQDVQEKFDKAIEEQILKNEKNLTEFLNTIESILPNDEGIAEVFGALLALDEVEFRILSTIIMEEFTKELSKVEMKMDIKTALQLGEFTYESFKTNIDSLIQKIEESDLEDYHISFFKKFFNAYLIAVEEIAKEKEIVCVQFELCREGAVVPTQGTPGSAAYDVYATEDYTIAPGETIIIPLGIKVAIPEGYALLVQPRSGLSYKSKLRIANTPGLIDSDYRDELGVIMENIQKDIEKIEYHFEDEDTDMPRPVIDTIIHGGAEYITKGERIAQLRLVKVPYVSYIQVDSVANIGENRGGGFGSTGTH